MSLLTSSTTIENSSPLPEGVSVLGKIEPGYEQILSFEALGFVAGLQRNFNARRLELLQNRTERQKKLTPALFRIF